MGKTLDENLHLEFTVRGHTVRMADLLAFLAVTVMAVFVRVALFGFASGDYTSFLAKWFDTLKESGGFGGIGLSLGDYTPPYIYIMALLTYLPVKSLISIKLVSCVFDFALAVFVMLFAYRARRNSSIAVTAYAAALFLPTVVLNSAFWAQCDVIFTLFLLLCVWYFAQNRPFAATLCFGISFCFKLQAIFLAPFLLLMWAKGRMKLRHFLIIPAAYLVSILPAFFAGRPLGELLTIYLNQSAQYTKLSLNAPNLYIFIGEDKTAALSLAAILLCGAAVLISLYLLYERSFHIGGRFLVTCALFYALLLPFLLPHMHERYFYVADILALVYAFYCPRRFYVAVLVEFASLAAYLPFLFGHSPIDLKLAAAAMFIALVLVTMDLIQLTGIRRRGGSDPQLRKSTKEIQ